MRKTKLIIVFFLIFIFFISTKSMASIKKQGIENFPDAYKPYLYAIKEKYPNWEFTALYTGFDWNYVISQEYRNNKNLVPLSYSDEWKCTDNGIYNVEIDKGWVNASKRAVEYVMDPRNFLNSVRLFQFEKLSYDANTNSKSGVEKILYGTEFYNRTVTYKLENGSDITMGVKYSDLIWDSAVYSGVSPYHLASRIKQEVGPFITHPSISGTVAGYEGLYNFYNIGATSSTETLGAIKNGLQFARDGKGATEEVKANLLLPWNNPEKAIKGGAVFIGKSYISVGQNTLYLQKFDVNDDRKGELFWHQYMTNCLAPYSESVGIYSAYNSNGMLNSSIGFVIPVYENMPDEICESPDIISSDYEVDNTKVYPNVTGNLNVRTGPSTSYEIIATVNKNDILTRIKKGVQNGERWDKVLLSNGMVGYVFQSYLLEVPKPTISSIKLQVENSTINKGSISNIRITVEPEDANKDEIIWTSSDEEILTVENGIIKGISSGKAIITAYSSDKSVSDSIEIIVYTPVTSITLLQEEINIYVGEEANIEFRVLPEDASNKEILWSSSNENIATVKNGVVTAKSKGTTDIVVKSKNENVEAKCKVIVKEINPDIQIEFDKSLRINNNEISNIDLNNSKVVEIKKLIKTNASIEFVNSNNKVLDDNEVIGTGSKLILKDKDENEIYRYSFIIYGDVNGDGLINSLDVLVLQKHILETKLLTGIYIKAGNTSKNGNLPSSLDVLRVQKHILEIKSIEQ